MAEFTQQREPSNIAWARYDEAAQRLEIDFKDSAGSKSSTYAYENFPPDERAQFNASTSRGKFFAFHIRPKYKGVKIWSAK